ncbi:MULTISPECIES: hypothetical protein [Rhodopseudomonas]|nr:MULTISPECIES: hypothetical protein [Rhodopseudomonas]MDF3814019.1 hypothetical protein [Rhodopseudomonas sp. BAL398]WOK16838.1 hypothetical protein RBJ75_22280 [Rhodopseudomonas sp. BAL398]
MVDNDSTQTDEIGTPDDTKLTLARAFDSAWERFLEREGTKSGTDLNRKRLAGRIVAAAKSGEADEAMLAEAGLIYLSVLAEATRIGNEPQSVEQHAFVPEPQGAQAFGPDTIAAMSAALEQCMQELPLQTPSSVLSFLTNSILEEASRGERDPERLSANALEALRNR